MLKDEVEEEIFYEKYEQKKSQNMEMSLKEKVRKVKQLNRIYSFLNDDGKDFIDTVQEEKRLRKAEEERLMAEQEKERQKTILNLYFMLNLSKEAIAQSMELSLEYVKNVIDTQRA